MVVITIKCILVAVLAAASVHGRGTNESRHSMTDRTESVDDEENKDFWQPQETGTTKSLQAEMTIFYNNKVTISELYENAEVSPNEPNYVESIHNASDETEEKYPWLQEDEDVIEESEVQHHPPIKKLLERHVPAEYFLVPSAFLVSTYFAIIFFRVCKSLRRRNINGYEPLVRHL